MVEKHLTVGGRIFDRWWENLIPEIRTFRDFNLSSAKRWPLKNDLKGLRMCGSTVNHLKIGDIDVLMLWGMGLCL